MLLTISIQYFDWSVDGALDLTVYISLCSLSAFLLRAFGFAMSLYNQTYVHVLFHLMFEYHHTQYNELDFPVILTIFSVLSFLEDKAVSQIPG